MKHLIIGVLAFVLPIISFAQTNPTQRIQLKNGVTINGTVQLLSDGTYEVISTTGDTFYFSPSEIARVVDLSGSAAGSRSKAQKTAVGKYTGWVIGSGVSFEQSSTSSTYYTAESGYLGWNFTAGYRFGNFFLGLQSGMGYGSCLMEDRHGFEFHHYYTGLSTPVLIATKYYFSNWKAQPYVHLAPGIGIISFVPKYFQLQIGPGVEIHFSPKIHLYFEPLYRLVAPFDGGVIPGGFAAHIGFNFYL